MFGRFISSSFFVILQCFCHFNFYLLTNAQSNQDHGIPYQVVESGQTFSLNCTKPTGTSRMHWDLPSTIDPRYYNQKNMKPLNQRSSSSGKRVRSVFVMTLTITNASFLDTGHYICRDGETFVKEVYVFVHDIRNLLLPPSLIETEKKFKVVGSFSQQNVSVGCAPTHPSLKVELEKMFKPNEFQTVTTSTEANSDWTYNIFEGFSFKKIDSWDIAGKYRCLVNESNYYSELFEIKIFGVELIRSPTGPVIKGTPLSISCRGKKLESATDSMEFSWQWIHNGEIFKFNQSSSLPGRPEMTSTFPSFNIYTGPIFSRTIQWDAVPLDATGIYECYDADDEHLKSSLILNVLDAVRETEEKRSSQFPDPSSKQPRVFKTGLELKIECWDFNSENDLRWVKPTNDDGYYMSRQIQPLSLRSSERKDYDGQHSFSILKIRNVSYLDTGFYTCQRVISSAIVYREFIYIEDPNNLILPPALRPAGPNRDLRVIGHYFEQNVPIGCGPTHPSVSVNLTKYLNENETKVIASSDNPNDPDSDWSFDPYEGFKIKMVDSWEMKGQHVCVATSPFVAKKTITGKFKIKIQGVEITSIDDRRPIYEGDELTLTCRSKNKDTMKLAWRWIPFNQTDLQEISPEKLPADGEGYDYPFEDGTISQEYPAPLGTFQVNRLRWKNIPIRAAGLYQCFDANDLKIPVSNITINVSSSKPPSLEGSNSTTELEIERGYEITLECRDIAKAPKTKIKWFIKKSENSEEEISNKLLKYYSINTTDDGHTSLLTIFYANSDGEFRCQFTSSKGQDQQFFVVQVFGLGDGIIAAISIVTIIVVVIIILIVLFVRSSYKQKRVYQELINNRLKLLEGNVDRIDPALPLEDQLDFLPYDSKYEFPVNHLVLGKQLGAGQFGRVLQAQAVGIGPGNTTVAVKMVKSQADNTALSSLASELKILIHIGFHMNIVSLVGACTKNLIKGELMVIVEFCRYGNLQDFLMENRKNYIDELKDDPEWKVNCHIQKDAPQPPVSPTMKNAEGDCNQDNAQVQGESSQQNETEKNASDNNGRYWLPTNKKGKSFRKRSPVICAHDLMNWSYQIACGMNYLTTRKVLHGDLAARNVLLADDDVVKIADFGLSRQVYKDCNYQKQGQEALPVKWMAIESLLDRVFSSQSDVWSFGVTIWEIFTLSKQPYPEVVELADLIRLLSNGYRMDKPELAPQIIGDILSDCWKEQPNERATFSQLEQTLGQLISKNNRERYANNGESYLHMHTAPKQKTKPVMGDYLRMTSTEEASAQSSIYQNLASSAKLPKLYPELSLYINTSPPQSPFVNPENSQNQEFGNVSGPSVITNHTPLSPTTSIAEVNYLAMNPASTATYV